MITTYRTFKTLLFTLFIVCNSIAQEKEIYIEYDYFLKGDEGKKKAFEVVSNKKESLCTTVSQIQLGNIRIINTEKNEEILPEALPKTFLYKDFINQNMVTEDNHITHKTYYVSESTNLFKWKLTGKTKKILKYNCQEVTTEFRGRKYVAYFTSDLPFKAGPWKFGGLPGAILEVSTIDNQVKIKAIQLKIRSASKIENPFPKKQTISWEDYRDQYVKNMKKEKKKREISMAKMRSQLIAKGIDPGKMSTDIDHYPRIEIIIEGNNYANTEKQMKKFFGNK